MCTAPTFLRGTNLNIGTAITVSEDILNGQEPFAYAVKAFEKETGTTASHNLDRWTTYPRKEELLKYFEKTELKEQRGNYTSNPKATAQAHRIDGKYNKKENTPKETIKAREKKIELKNQELFKQKENVKE